MFVVHCPTCDRSTLLGVDEIDWVQNLTPGMISVSGHCPFGHDVVVLTGDAFTPHEDPRRYGPAPHAWKRPLHHLGDAFGRGLSALRRRFHYDPDLDPAHFRVQ